MEKKIPIKNYVILALVFTISILAVFYARVWYNTTKEYYAQNSVMTKSIMEIKYSEEISSYILENQRLILYASSGKDFQIKDFEDDFRDLVIKLDVTDEMLYMNLDGIDTDSFYNLLRNDFASNSKIKNQIVSSSASLYLFTNGKLTNVLNNVDDYSIKRLEIIMESWVADNA